MKKLLLFDKSIKTRILESLHKGVDKDGYIIELDSHERILNQNGEEIKYDDFIAFRQGSEIFYSEEDLVDMVKLHDKIYGTTQKSTSTNS